MKASDALKRAQELGLGLTFTEHFDWEFPGEDDFTFNGAAYFSEYEPLCGRMLRLGAEIGIAGDTAAKNRELVVGFPFDMVIGSIHLLHGKDLYFKAAYEGLTRQAAYEQYFKDMAFAIREQGANFDVLGHIDYIARCAPYENPEITYADFGDFIDEVLRSAIANGVILEINTRRLGDTKGRQTLVPIYKRYHELGGRYVTVGSDAHNVQTIGKYFSVAMEMVVACSLTPVSFRRRNIEK